MDGLGILVIHKISISFKQNSAMSDEAPCKMVLPPVRQVLEVSANINMFMDPVRKVRVVAGFHSI